MTPEDQVAPQMFGPAAAAQLPKVVDVLRPDTMFVVAEAPEAEGLPWATLVLTWDGIENGLAVQIPVPTAEALRQQLVGALHAFRENGLWAGPKIAGEDAYGCWVWLTKEDDGSEGVVTGMVPGIGAVNLQGSRAVVDVLEPLARAHAERTGRPVRLVQTAGGGGVVGTHVEVSGTFPRCDIVDEHPAVLRPPAIVDGRTKHGPWANMCVGCWVKHGCGQLGTGHGQLLRLRPSHADIDGYRTVGDVGGDGVTTYLSDDSDVVIDVTGYLPASMTRGVVGAELTPDQALQLAADLDAAAREAASGLFAAGGKDA